MAEVDPVQEYLGAALDRVRQQGVACVSSTVDDLSSQGWGDWTPSVLARVVRHCLDLDLHGGPEFLLVKEVVQAVLEKTAPVDLVTLASIMELFLPAMDEHIQNVLAVLSVFLPTLASTGSVTDVIDLLLRTHKNELLPRMMQARMQFSELPAALSYVDHVTTLAELLVDMEEPLESHQDFFQLFLSSILPLLLEAVCAKEESSFDSEHGEPEFGLSTVTCTCIRTLCQIPDVEDMVRAIATFVRDNFKSENWRLREGASLCASCLVIEGHDSVLDDILRELAITALDEFSSSQNLCRRDTSMFLVRVFLEQRMVDVFEEANLWQKLSECLVQGVDDVKVIALQCFNAVYYLGSVLSDCSEDVQEVVAVPLLRKSVHLVESVSLDDNEWKDHANAFEAVAALLCGNLSALDEHLEVLQQLFAASVSKLSNQMSSSVWSVVQESQLSSLLIVATEVCRYKGCDVRNVESLVAVLDQIVEHRNLSRSLLMDTLMGVGVLIQEGRISSHWFVQHKESFRQLLESLDCMDNEMVGVAFFGVLCDLTREGSVQGTELIFDDWAPILQHLLTTSLRKSVRAGILDLFGDFFIQADLEALPRTPIDSLVGGLEFIRPTPHQLQQLSEDSADAEDLMEILDCICSFSSAVFLGLKGASTNERVTNLARTCVNILLSCFTVMEGIEDSGQETSLVASLRDLVNSPEWSHLHSLVHQSEFASFLQE